MSTEPARFQVWRDEEGGEKVKRSFRFIVVVPDSWKVEIQSSNNHTDYAPEYVNPVPFPEAGKTFSTLEEANALAEDIRQMHLDKGWLDGPSRGVGASTRRTGFSTHA